MFIKSLFEEHPGMVIGISLGLIIGLIFLFVGFWKTVVFIGFVGLGLYIGRKFDNHKDFRDILEDLLPDKFFK